MQRRHDLAGGDRHGAGGEAAGVAVGDHVVVVALEGARGMPSAGGERVQLGVRDVADQVRPQAAMTRPGGRVDVDGQPATARPTASSIRVRQVRTRSASR